jgi:hypothetical protein
MVEVLALRELARAERADRQRETGGHPNAFAGIFFAFPLRARLRQFPENSDAQPNWNRTDHFHLYDV